MSERSFTNPIGQARSSGIDAELNYLEPLEGRPYTYMYEPPGGTSRQNCKYEACATWIADARTMPVAPTIDVEGFELRDAPTSVISFHDNDAIRAKYYGEAIELAKHVTGATQAYIFDHAIREREPGRPPLTFGRAGNGSRPGAAGRVHNDYTETSGLKRYDLVARDNGLRSRAHYYAVVNIWRSIAGKVEDTPLALCDARTVTARELVAADIIYPSRRGEIYLVHKSAHHSWAYFSRMDRQEALVFKQYDARVNGVARFTPHAAFDLPSIPPGAPLRRSIEVRCLVIYD